MHKAILKEKEERRLLRGHLWAYRNEFQTLPPLEDGEVVDVVAHNHRFVGRGFYQAEGGIAVRLLTRENEEVDRDMFVRRIRAAGRFRERIFPDSTTYRWIYGESDRLPGLVADRYDAVVAVQSACAFYGRYLEDLAEGFMSFEGVAGVRFEVGGRVSTFGEVPSPVEVNVDGLRLSLGLGGHQKTGMFLDQRENWQTLRPYAPDARVFDGFCYIGPWGLEAARHGARSVLGVDTSARAVEAARAHARLNGCEDVCEFRVGDVSEVLREPGARYDLVFLDPPALAKTRAHVKKALGLYQALNRDAMAALEPGGYLITSSCSHFLDLPSFIEVIKRAARAAQREVWIVEIRSAARDHPVLLSMPETAYLKNLTVRVF